ncbi:MAG TPA: peptidoglycan DD-metalloendopeptidase family protein [Thermoanaerobaculales bacterium]|nr:peptidoglycan DD-metalloendopeptidase family protein [Thermoanaerobaculales bacterium]HPA79654.1 peptidoglycan DD-metalloendopeptidase family protein [Thermoanaerobaculales bacterium]HQL28977.1 peptidoglycan DD-metalloendopeptidase family protein [Thermoanaerobaculales bacterium]HQN96257.1 peptidoglycan DD-metalloendopeptidase family protein [Thermoanaerobaculales bacterium]HQP42309.1 peptidoglycan DD-metalloendopeptidase family protein [Thermoanaerobaculales bacterium]
MANDDSLIEVLRRHRGAFAPVIPFDLAAGEPVVFDFTSANRDLERVGSHDTVSFAAYLFEQISAGALRVGVGRWDEDRVTYRHSPLFDDAVEQRSVHLGIDLFVTPGTEVHTPLDATLHSCADNDRLGDYGPTIILEHTLDGVRFHTLYGHLGRPSLAGLGPGLSFAAGDLIGWVGEQHENGGWPPHLHFQVIADLQGRRGDFPGVAAPSQRARYLALCPDPNLILGIRGL